MPIDSTGNEQPPRHLKMPNHSAEVDDAFTEKLIQGGGLKEKTLYRRKKVAEDFSKYVADTSSSTFQELIAGEKTNLEKTIIKYFQTMTVGQKQEDGSVIQIMPKRNTLDFIKSNLKLVILAESEQKIDITNSVQFPKFSQFLKGLQKETKAQGRGDTDHHKPIDKESLAKIFKLGADVSAVFDAKESGGNVADAVSKLPQEYQGSYHYLLQHMVQFLLTLFDVRRGQEGIDSLTKTHFKKEHYQEGGYDIYRKVKGEQSKNHHQDGENFDNSGIIPCNENEFGFNPGHIFDIYLGLLHPDCESLFQRPRRPSKHFNLNVDSELFEPSKVGKNMVGTMMKRLCKTLGLPEYTNHCLRSTGIVLLKEQGFGDREIMRLSGHRQASSLEHYDPSNSVEKKAKMAASLLLKRPAAVEEEDKENSYLVTPAKSPRVSDEMVDPKLILLHREQDRRKSD